MKEGFFQGKVAKRITLPSSSFRQLKLPIEVIMIRVFHEVEVVEGGNRRNDCNVALILLWNNHPTPIEPSLKKHRENTELHNLVDSVSQLRWHQISKSLKEGATSWEPKEEEERKKEKEDNLSPPETVGKIVLLKNTPRFVVQKRDNVGIHLAHNEVIDVKLLWEPRHRKVASRGEVWTWAPQTKTKNKQTNKQDTFQLIRPPTNFPRGSMALSSHLLFLPLTVLAYKGPGWHLTRRRRSRSTRIIVKNNNKKKKMNLGEKSGETFGQKKKTYHIGRCQVVQKPREFVNSWWADSDVEDSSGAIECFLELWKRKFTTKLTRFPSSL